MFTCDLFIYSQVSGGCLSLPVHRDEEFLKDVIVRAEHFYFNKYLPATYADFSKATNETNKRMFTGVNIINNLQ